MAFKHRVARKWGETVSKESDAPVPTMPKTGPADTGNATKSSTSPARPANRSKQARKQAACAVEAMAPANTIQVTKRPGKKAMARTSAKKAAKRAERKTLAPVNARKITKQAAASASRNQYQRVSRASRSSSRLTADDDQLSPEKAYLSYHDILLTYEDIKALRHDWLTDNNIAFWEEWLEREILPRYPQASIVLLRPSMTFLLMKNPDIKSVALALPSFSKVTHIFLPINDNRDVAQAEGGLHWSLLLVSTLDRVAFHYDSLGNLNYGEAMHCTNQLARILGTPLKFHQIDDCPRQDNSNDCGVFVCILMRHLLVKRLLNANAREKVSMSMENKMIDSNGGRKEMMKIIESLRKEGERRRSASPFASNDTPPRIE